MAKSYDEKIAEGKKKIKQEQNHMKQLIQKQKVQERKDRTKRLCRRMGLFESMLPDTIPLSEEKFKIFLEKTITTEHSRRILEGLSAQNNTPTTHDSAQTKLVQHTSDTANQGNSTRVSE